MITVFELKTEGKLYREVEEFTAQEAHDVCSGLNRICKRLVGEVEPIAGYPYFSVRAENTLKRCRIKTFGELSQWNKQFPGAGRKTYEEFRVALVSYGLDLPAEIDRYLKRNEAP